MLNAKNQTGGKILRREENLYFEINEPWFFKYISSMSVLYPGVIKQIVVPILKEF